MVLFPSGSGAPNCWQISRWTAFLDICAFLHAAHASLPRSFQLLTASRLVCQMSCLCFKSMNPGLIHPGRLGCPFSIFLHLPRVPRGYLYVSIRAKSIPQDLAQGLEPNSSSSYSLCKHLSTTHLDFLCLSFLSVKIIDFCFGSSTFLISCIVLEQNIKMTSFYSVKRKG